MRAAIIVGAGVSGLVAAWHLQRRASDALVVESRSRVGGRTWSPELAEEHFDLGATWIWESEASVGALIDELRLGTFASFEADALYDVGASVERISRPRSAVAALRLEGGTGAIANALCERVAVVTERAARSIEPRSDGVRVVFDDGEERARHVVLALPPALIGTGVHVGGVSNEVLARLSQTPTWMGNVAKVVAVYDRPFWRERGLSGAFSRVGPMVEVHDMSGPDPAGKGALFGFVPEVLAGDASWEERARTQLVHLFGDAARDPVAWLAHAWWRDAATARVPAGPTIDALFGHPLLRRPLLDGRLHLASTETSAVNTGHIDGAVKRGIAVAEAIAADAKHHAPLRGASKRTS